MMRNNKVKKLILQLMMVTTSFVPFAAFAQGGIFQRGDSEKEIQNAIFQRSGGDGIIVTNQTFGHYTEGVDVTNQTFDVPLGNGIITLLVASTGYAGMKTNKRNKKSRKENK